MDMTKNPRDMTDLELSTAVYHISVNNQTAKTFTLQKMTDILSEAAKRLYDVAKGKPLPMEPFADLEDSGGVQGELGPFGYKTVVTSVDNQTGEVEQATLDLDQPSIEKLREHIRQREERNPTVEQNIKRDWSFSPEDMDDYVGDPQAED